MNRRAYLAAVATSLSAIAGCTDNSDDDDETIPDDGNVVFQDTVGSDSGMDMGGGNGGTGGSGIDGGAGDGGMGGDDGGSAFVHTQELEEGELLEVRITNQAYGTEYDIYSPDGETLVQEATDGEDTVTIEAERTGEYDVVIAPDGGNAEVVIIVVPPGDDSSA